MALQINTARKHHSVSLLGTHRVLNDTNLIEVMLTGILINRAWTRRMRRGLACTIQDKRKSLK